MSRSGDGHLIHRRYSLSYRIMSVLVLIGIILITILFSILYSHEVRSLESEFKLSQNYTEQSLTSSVKLLQETLYVYGDAYDPKLKYAMSEYYREFNASGRDPEAMNIQGLKSLIEDKTGSQVDLYLIDDNGVIITTTDTSEKGLDFKQYPDFYQSLNAIRLGNKYTSDAIVRSLKTGEYHTYGYQPTPDHRYVLEVAVAIDDLRDRLNFSSYSSISNAYTRDVPGVKSVFVFGKLALYDRDPEKGIEHPDQYNVPYTPVFDRLELLNQTFATKKDFLVLDPEGNQCRKYLYVAPPQMDMASSTELAQVIEIVYDAQYLKDSKQNALLTYLIIAVSCIILVILAALAITRYITHPIDQIVADIEIISDGAYDHSITHTHGFDFQRLEISIGKMVNRLKADIINIRGKSDELDCELKQRIAAEESLRIVNKKLNLLSSVTRHDILNQLSAITGALELLPEKMSDKGCLHLVDIIQRSVVNINKQISFTRVYEEMGTHQPEWQRMAGMVRHAREALSLHGVRVEDNTGLLELYVDPMADRAIFNLFENAVRHGGEVSCITLTFEAVGKEGILVISDDGYGVIASEKEKIFIRGYGSNTGLGLFLVREIFLITGITISERGAAGTGARFEMHIPESSWRIGSDESFHS